MSRFSVPLDPPRVEVVIEIPRGSFLKRGSDGHVDFISPFPCPFNYGSVHQFIGGEGDYLDAVVLGTRLAAGSRVEIPAWGAAGLSERYMYDDKLICAHKPVSGRERERILRFFWFYALCKGLLNKIRGKAGPARCEGWGDAGEAILRAVPIGEGRPGPRIGF